MNTKNKIILISALKTGAIAAISSLILLIPNMDIPAKLIAIPVITALLKSILKAIELSKG